MTIPMSPRTRLLLAFGLLLVGVLYLSWGIDALTRPQFDALTLGGVPAPREPDAAPAPTTPQSAPRARRRPPSTKTRKEGRS